MRTINVSFEDEDIEKLLIAKDGKSWRDFIMEKCLDEEKEE